MLRRDDSLAAPPTSSGDGGLPLSAMSSRPSQRSRGRGPATPANVAADMSTHNSSSTDSGAVVGPAPSPTSAGDEHQHHHPEVFMPSSVSPRPPHVRCCGGVHRDLPPHVDGAAQLEGNGEMAPIAVGFMLMSLVFSFGYLSGGHVNPMVTVSVWLCTASGEGYAVFNKRRLILYVIAQMAGGTLAGLFTLMIEGNNFPVPNMGDDFGRMVRGFLAESVFTFVLCSVVLHVAVSKQRNNNFYGFAIGFAVLCGGLACGPVSGGAFNPAVATPLIVIRCFFSFTKDGCLPMGSLWVYWASEVVGAVMASIMYLALMNVEENV